MRRYKGQINGRVKSNVKGARLKAAATNSTAKQKGRRDAGATKPGAATNLRAPLEEERGVIR
jgi:hypothetical protein